MSDTHGAGHIALFGKMMEEGLIRPDYFREPCGRFWLGLAGIDPEYLWRVTMRRWGLVAGAYTPLKKCIDSDRWDYQERSEVVPESLKPFVKQKGWTHEHMSVQTDG